jgi:hypothetical protein
MGAALMAIVLFGTVAAPAVLAVFGHQYAVHAAGTLRLLLLAGIPQGAVVVWMAVERVRARPGRVLVMQAVQSTLALTGIALGSVVLGIGWGWFIAQLLVGCAVAPSLLRTMGSRGPLRPNMRRALAPDASNR